MELAWAGGNWTGLHVSITAQIGTLHWGTADNRATNFKQPMHLFTN